MTMPLGKGEIWVQPYTHKDSAMREGSRDGGDKRRSQGMPKILANHEKLGKRHGTNAPSKPSEGADSTVILILDFGPVEL